MNGDEMKNLFVFLVVAVVVVVMVVSLFVRVCFCNSLSLSVSFTALVAHTFIHSFGTREWNRTKKDSFFFFFFFSFRSLLLSCFCLNVKAHTRTQLHVIYNHFCFTRENKGKNGEEKQKSKGTESRNKQRSGSHVFNTHITCCTKCATERENEFTKSEIECSTVCVCVSARSVGRRKTLQINAKRK